MASVHIANAMAGWLPDRATIDGLLTSLGGDDRADDTAATGWGLLPGPFYTPETSLGLRSEEHTSELQSLMRISYAVFCLKKKNKQQPDTAICIERSKVKKF